ncbi:hypothetical protein GWI33_002138 [Rhynchophorus ferrugineus]|uniref:Uncharacterized protein n=1 Tax=Rhynchophorus ferrugineus TaxID=354439 RepID=A0A834HS12_RHYFE|nr:hypothetical protein GWI33_002140 [Rhynchophorus ferrugineus]KAF7263515.1 hypothetical protein GWI33_002138 [Rhynchophorus ferrugineus]
MRRPLYKTLQDISPCDKPFSDIPLFVSLQICPPAATPTLLSLDGVTRKTVLPLPPTTTKPFDSVSALSCKRSSTEAWHRRRRRSLILQ